MTDDLLETKISAAAAAAAAASVSTSKGVRSLRMRSSLATSSIVHLGGSATMAAEEERDSLTGLSFMERVQCELFDATRVCLGFCRNASPVSWAHGGAEFANRESPTPLVPVFGASIVRPVSMNDSPSLGTLDVVLSTLIHQLADLFSKAAPGLHHRDLEVMSVSRIESSMGLAMLDLTAPIEESAPESREEKRQHIFLRSCHVLLNSIEETLSLVIAHCQYFLSMNQADLRRQKLNATKYNGNQTTLGNITNMSMSTTLATSFSSSSSVGISEELAASVLRSISKLERMLENRMINAPVEERELLEDKKLFLMSCANFFAGQ